MKGRLARLIALISLIAIVLAVIFVAALPTAASAPDQVAIAELQQRGIDFNVLSATEARLLQPQPNQDTAVAAAAKLFAPVDPPIAFLGRLTDRNAHVGDVSTPLLIENRLAFAVQMTGLNLPPFGGGAVPGQTPRTVPATLFHHERWVFVDATTYEFLGAIDFR